MTIDKFIESTIEQKVIEHLQALKVITDPLDSLPDPCTGAELAPVLRCTEDAIWRLVRANQIPHFRIGHQDKSIRFLKSQIKAWILEGGAKKFDEETETKEVLSRSDKNKLRSFKDDK